MAEDTVSDQIIERAVELWCRALRRPKFDNGDTSPNSIFGQALADMAINAAVVKVDDYDAAIDRFRSALTQKLKFLRDNDGLPTGKEGKYGPETYYFDRHLGVDYHPDRDLAEAADEAGLPHRLFSVKSSVSFFSPACVVSSFGYRARQQNHYPLSDGSWLVCGIQGDDMSAIIAAVEAGRLPELTVEPPSLPAGGANG